MARYYRGVNLLAQQIDANLFYYTHNAHGDVVQRIRDNGEAARPYEYDAFGNQKNYNDTDPNPFRYCGEYIDAETRTYYLRARMYEPRTGRFTSEDTLREQLAEMPNGQEVIDPLSLNLYTYCYNNPVKYIDPSGASVASEESISDIQWLDDFLNSLDMEPDYIQELNGHYIPSFEELTAADLNFITAIINEFPLAEAVEIILSHFKIDIPFEKFGDLITPAPFGRNTVNRFAGEINKLGKVAGAIAIIGLVFNIANTWTADSGNTIAQRLIKTAVQIADFGLSYGLGTAAVKFGIAATPYITPVGGFILGVAVAWGGNKLKNAGKDWLYNKFDIK